MGTANEIEESNFAAWVKAVDKHDYITANALLESRVLHDWPHSEMHLFWADGGVMPPGIEKGLLDSIRKLRKILQKEAKNAPQH